MDINKTTLQEMLDIAYELEGVLHLALTRYDEMPHSLPKIIRRKVEDLNACLNDYPDDHGDPDDSDCTDDSDYHDIADNSEITEITASSDTVPEYSEPSEQSEPSQPSRKTISSQNPPAFSLNDRFLFTRELFGDSRGRFDAALDRLALMDSMDEAESFFYDECGFDPSNETVTDFMRIVEGYLASR